MNRELQLFTDALGRRGFGTQLQNFSCAKSKAKIVGEGGYLRDISKFNFRQELKVLILSITVAINQNLSSYWSRKRGLRFRTVKSLLHFSIYQLFLHSPSKALGTNLSFRISIQFFYAEELLVFESSVGYEAVRFQKYAP